MCRILYETNPKNSLVMNSPLSPPSPISTTYNSYNHEMGSASSTFNKISPVLLLVIITLALIFFISGLLHLLVRFLMKRPAFSIVYGSNRFPETSGSHLPLQRQLQQLFRLHDSGLDQASIEALPVFYYKDIMGLKEPFDCAVCLCEFSELDKLRLLPSCSHAFHIQCIDTWLLSSSTCPLCRGTLSSSNPITENPWSNSHLSRQVSMTNQIPTDEANASFSSPVVVEESGGEKRVFSVRLGKFRSLNKAENNGERGQGEASGSGSGSGANLDGRRCYSMGTYQYVEVDSDLQVALSNHTVGGDNGCSASVDEGDGEGKRIKGRSRGDSFSVSKIWLWSKNTKFPTLSSAFLDVSSSSSSSFDVSLPINHQN